MSAKTIGYRLCRGVAAVACAAWACAAMAYQDDFVTIDDDTVQCTVDGDSRTYVFTNTAATATVTLRQTMYLNDLLVVGGGGGGGWTVGGGGGGGGVRHEAGLMMSLVAGKTMSVTVGAGGLSPLKGTSRTAGGSWLAGLTGGNSTLTVEETTYTGHGGGGGGGWDSATKTGFTGGSSGGACQGNSAKAVTKDADEKGNKGGNSVSGKYPGGGGGATEAGADGTSSIGGKGGEGYACDITGESVVYGSGGGAGGGTGNGFATCNVGGTNAGSGSADYLVQGTSGVAGTGGGGGGGGYTGAANMGGNGGHGGSGVVVLVLVKPSAEVRTFDVASLGPQDFTGSAVCPKPTVTDSEDPTRTMTEGTHYTLSWSDNAGLGTGTVTVTGLGSYAYTVKSTTFEIIDGFAESEGVTMQIVGDRIVYVYPSVVAASRLRLKTPMRLEEALVVAGGGAGGWTIGGGGGGGGVKYLTPAIDFLAGDHLRVTVGKGGGPNDSGLSWGYGGNGGNSELHVFQADTNYVAHGGGGGGGWDYSQGRPGASSGGGSHGNETRVQPVKDADEFGNAGGGSFTESSGGGGGATAAGADGTSNGAAGAGGEGYPCSITGTSQVYGSGGGGGAGNSCTAAAAGGTNAGAGGNPGSAGKAATDGFGGGGGGGSYGGAMPGGAGGCGTVILSFSKLTTATKTFDVADIVKQTHTGAAIEPEPVVTDRSDGTTLVKGTHYSVSWTNNVEIGTAYAVVTGLGDYARNRWRVPFLIVDETAVDAKWLYEGTTLTEILPPESGNTAWVFTLTSAGALSVVTRGTTADLDFGDGALPTNAPEILSVAASAFGSSKTFASVTLPTGAVTIAANAFKDSSAIRGIAFEGWYDLVGSNVAIGNWSDKKCRFVVPGDNANWLKFIANALYVEPWVSLAASVQAEYTARYGTDEHLIPVGLTVAGGTPVNRTWIVKTDAELSGSVILVTDPDARFGAITLSPAARSDGTYEPGTSVTVTFVPEDGVAFLGWSTDVPEAERGKIAATVVADGTKTVSASYVADFLIYSGGKLTDGVQIATGSGSASAITVTGASRLDNGCLDVSKPVYGGKIVSISGFNGASSKYVNWLRRVILPDTLETIGNQAFDCCTSITNVTPLLPRSLKTIGYSAFAKTSIRGNVELGFGTESDGLPRMVTLSETNVGYTGNRLADSTGVGPCIRIGPGVTKLSGAMFVNMGAGTVTNIYIGANVSNITAGTFSAYTKCDVTFAGDQPAMVNNSFLAPSSYAYRLFVPYRGMTGWSSFVTNETKLTRWHLLPKATRAQYYSRWPGGPRPYGLTTSAACAGDHAVPANQWLFCDRAEGGSIVVR